MPLATESEPDLMTEPRPGQEAGAWTPPTVKEASTLFPGYEVVSLIGSGGMGVVYQARQIELDRPVAIKLLPERVSADAEFATRFRREARAMGKLNHGNIISIYDLGKTSAGHLYFVMEFVEGANLHDVIQKVGLNQEQALSVAVQVCTALGYAHRKGIVHRDIKPENVLIDTESHVKVADFGLARLMDRASQALGHTMPGFVMGTPDYMAPEQTRGMDVDHRADIYSVGVMIYEMLCGKMPMGIFDPPSVRSKCDKRIDKIVAKAMQQSPDRRYQSIKEMRADLKAVAKPVEAAAPQGAPAATPAAAAVAAPAAPGRSSRVPLYTGLLVALVAIPAGALLALMAKSKGTVPDAAAAAPVAVVVDAGKREEAVAKTAGNESGSMSKSISTSTTGRAEVVPSAEKTGAAVLAAPINLLGLTDAVEDRLAMGTSGRANTWEKINGVLRYKSDGKPGKIVAPVAVDARSYEMEINVVRLGGESALTLDLPVGHGEILSVSMLAPGTKLLDGEAGPAWPADLPDGGRIALHYEAPSAGEKGRLVVQFDGRTIADVQDDFRPRLKSMDPHPAFPGKTLPALLSARDSFEITAWSLRVLDGEAKVLRGAGQAQAPH